VSSEESWKAVGESGMMVGPLPAGRGSHSSGNYPPGCAVLVVSTGAGGSVDGNLPVDGIGSLATGDTSSHGVLLARTQSEFAAPKSVKSCERRIMGWRCDVMELQK
jgi:hypothetical protein